MGGLQTIPLSSKTMFAKSFYFLSLDFCEIPHCYYLTIPAAASSQRSAAHLRFNAKTSLRSSSLERCTRSCRCGMHQWNVAWRLPSEKDLTTTKKTQLCLKSRGMWFGEACEVIEGHNNSNTAKSSHVSLLVLN